MIFSNNNAYVQPCAPGTRNSNYNSYNYGGHYHYRDFCDVNLVDHGYGVRHGYGFSHDTHYSKGAPYGHQPHSDSYGKHSGAYGHVNVHSSHGYGKQHKGYPEPKGYVGGHGQK